MLSLGLNMGARLPYMQQAFESFYALFGNSIVFKDGNQIISSDNRTIVPRN